jgi:hypothetical protein
VDYEFWTQRPADHVAALYRPSGAEVPPSCVTELGFDGVRRLRLISTTTGAVLHAGERRTRLDVTLASRTEFGASYHRHEYPALARLARVEGSAVYFPLKDGSYLYVEMFNHMITHGEVAPDLVLGIEQRRDGHVVATGGDYELQSLELVPASITAVELSWFVPSEARGRAVIGLRD